MQGSNAIAKEHKRRFYVPGMISLVLIPLVCIAWLFLHKNFNPPRSMNLPLLSKEGIEEIKKEFGAFPVPRLYNEFSFDGVNHIDSHKMLSLRKAMRKLKQSKDTVTGIRIHFTEDADYETLINTLDLIAIEKMPNYILYGNDIWLHIVPQKKGITQGIIPLITCEFIPNAKYYKAISESDQRKQIELYKRFPALFGGWSLLFCLNIFVLIKWHRNKTYLQKPYI